LTGRKSNNAISFETILQILTFITNYANIHGLPSPGISYNDFLSSLIIINLLKFLKKVVIFGRKLQQLLIYQQVKVMHHFGDYIMTQ
jgi:hypothetical protein